MATRGPLHLPITLGILMIVLLVALTVGWVFLAVGGAVTATRLAGVYWAALSVGTTFLVLVLVGVVLYLTLSIKAINLNRRQANFIDSVTHELKSPIASLKLYLQTIHRRNVNREELASFHRYMLEDVERLDQLINHLLDAGRLEKGAVQEELEQVVLEPLLRECAVAICSRYGVPGETVQLDVDPCMVWGRRGDVEIVFRNLIDNAVKYAGEAPRVQVTARWHPPHRVTARISDNGRGIPPKLRRKIFGRFVRLGLELERDKPGTGLGLYIVRTLVGRLKGTIRVRGRAEGPGTVFEVILPGDRMPAPAAAGPLPESSSVA